MSNNPNPSQAQRSIGTTDPILLELLNKSGVHWKEKQDALQAAVKEALSTEDYYDDHFGEAVSRQVITPFTELTTRVYIASNVVMTSTNIKRATAKQPGDIPKTIHPSVNVFLCNDKKGNGTEFGIIPRGHFKKRLGRYDFASRWSNLNTLLANKNLYLKPSPSDGAKAGDSASKQGFVTPETMSKYLLFVRDVMEWYFLFVEFPPSTHPDGRFNRDTVDCAIFGARVNDYVKKMEKTLSFILRDMALRDGTSSASTLDKVRELMNRNRWSTMTKVIGGYAPQLKLLSVVADSKKYISSDQFPPNNKSETNNPVAEWLRKMWQDFHSSRVSMAFSTLSCLHCHPTVFQRNFFYNNFLSSLHENCFVVASKVSSVTGNRVICTMGTTGTDEGRIHLPFNSDVLFMTSHHSKKIKQNYAIKVELNVGNAPNSISKIILSTLESTGTFTVSPPTSFADVTTLLNQWVFEMNRGDTNPVTVGNIGSIASGLDWDFIFEHCKTDDEMLEMFVGDVFSNVGDVFG